MPRSERMATEERTAESDAYSRDIYRVGAATGCDFFQQTLRLGNANIMPVQ